jgi:hypothetical protein
MNKNIHVLLNFLNKFNKDFSNQKIRSVSNNRIFDSKFMFLRYLVSNKEFHNLPHKDIVLNFLSKSEQYYPGSSYLTSVYLVDKLLGNTCNFDKVKADKNLVNLLAYFKSKSSNNSASLMFDILNFSGPDAVLSCKSTKNQEIKVLKKKNPIFKVDLHEDFVSTYFSNQKEITKNCIISVMDAFIERESELIPLIEHSKNQNAPIVLFCRGMSHIVINQLKQILLRNNIFLYPYIIKFSNDDPFLLKDIAKTLNTDVITADTGDSIYRDSVLKAGSGKIRLKSNEIEVFNPNKDLLIEINEQLFNKTDSSLKKYLTRRKSRISTNFVEILIPMEKIEILNDIKCLVKCYNYISMFGFYEINNVLYSKREVEIANKLSKSLFDCLKNIGYVLKIGSKNV